MRISGKTKIIGIFGYPIEHTLSPAMHNAAFANKGLDFVYVPFKILPKKLKTAVDSLKALDISGINVTVPHKEKIMGFLDKIDSLAKKIGSVNTVTNTNGLLTGYNTDGIGFLRDIKNLGFNPKGKTAIVIGSGGGGKSVAASLSWAGARRIFLTDKKDILAAKLAKKIKKGEFIPFKNLEQKIKECDILINATPIGMRKSDPELVSANLLKKGLFVYDIVYNRESRLIKDAKKLKLKAFNGIGMLLNQGAAAFEIWTKEKAPVKIMKKALISALRGD